MASYSYDENGQSLFFLLTFLVFALAPWTWYTFSNQRRKVTSKPPCKGWNRKTHSVVSVKRRTAPISINRIALAAGWALLAFVTYKAAQAKAANKLYDPFAILGISSSTAEKDIKRHFRKLSLKFHPDKLKLEGNQTKEEADSHFVEITKAYKALTDEEVRKNYELYGHPDGKQEFGMGIAIPVWIVEGKNNVYVLGVYGILFGLCLPFFVGKWWFGTRAYTKDRVLNSTATHFFRELKETSSFEQVVEILSAAVEFEKYHQKFKPGPNWNEVERQVIERLEAYGTKLDGPLLQRPYARWAAILLYAHMLRVPIEDQHLLDEVHSAVAKATHLTTSLGNMAQAQFWLRAYFTSLDVRQRLIQALHPSLPPILQLPHLEPSMVNKGLATVPAFLNGSELQRKELLSALSDEQREEVQAVAKAWPRPKIVSAEYSVKDEKYITPLSFVQMTMRIRLSPPSENVEEIEAPLVKINGVLGDDEAIAEDVEDDFKLRPEGAPKFGSKDSQEAQLPIPLHAPHLPGSGKPTWQVVIADHRSERIFVLPQIFQDVGSATVRTIEFNFQIPLNPGTYAFVVHFKSDSYVGVDTSIDTMMKVEPPADVKEAEDDISEPEEDSLAGQMAAMRGQPVKRLDDEDEDDEDEDDDTSGSEDGEVVVQSSDSDSD